MKFLKKLCEPVLEIILSLIMFLIGFGALSLFGIELTAESDPELALLIGSVIFLVPFLIIAFCVNKYKCKKENQSQVTDKDENIY